MHFFLKREEIVEVVKMTELRRPYRRFGNGRIRHQEKVGDRLKRESRLVGAMRLEQTLELRGIQVHQVTMVGELLPIQEVVPDYIAKRFLKNAAFFKEGELNHAVLAGGEYIATSNGQVGARNIYWGERDLKNLGTAFDRYAHLLYNEIDPDTMWVAFMAVGEEDARPLWVGPESPINGERNKIINNIKEQLRSREPLLKAIERIVYKK
ncbi:MAG: hypothetical protein AABW87_01135 [Nanoarchaeota archaeon]